MEAILTRRSVRSYEDRAVSEESIDSMLRAAMAAPSAANQRPWQFVVIEDRRILEQVPKVQPHAAMAAEAPLAIVVCGDTKRAKHPIFWVQDCAAATQNLLLAAHAHGLGAVWCGIHPNEEVTQAVQKLLSLPEEVIPLALIPVGHPAETKPPTDRYDPSRIHRDRWMS